jgi:hypothetical protein
VRNLPHLLEHTLGAHQVLTILPRLLLRPRLTFRLAQVLIDRNDELEHWSISSCIFALRLVGVREFGLVKADPEL